MKVLLEWDKHGQLTDGQGKVVGSAKAIKSCIQDVRSLSIDEYVTLRAADLNDAMIKELLEKGVVE